MKKITHYFSFVTLVQNTLFTFLLLAFTHNAMAQIKPFHALYSVGNAAFTAATLDSKFEKKPGKHSNIYQYTSVTKAAGFFAYVNKDVMTETTTLIQKDDGIYPLKYQFVNKKANKTERATLVFDHYKNVVQHQKDKRKVTKKLLANAFDNNSITLGIMAWMQQKQGKVKQGDVLPVFDNHDHLKVWPVAYKVDKQETLNLPYGKVNAIKIVPVGKPAPLQTNMWLSPKHGFIPVKFEYLNNDTLALKIELKKLY